MNIISWNCRGLGNPNAVRALKELVRSNRPEVIFLLETLVQTSRLNEIKRMLNFHGCFGVNVVGRSGGLALLWKESCKLEIRSYNQNFIDARIFEANGRVWRLIGLYGYPERDRRQAAWDLTREISQFEVGPWMCVGDFNDMLRHEEKEGGLELPSRLVDGFRKAVEDACLRDLHAEGSIYTWERWSGGRLVMREKLDRAMANEDWFRRYPNNILCVLNTTYSDHSPLLIKTDQAFIRWRSTRFRFENLWLLEPILEGLVRDSWSNNGVLGCVDRLTTCPKELRQWGRANRGDYGLRIRILEGRINDIKAKQV